MLSAPILLKGQGDLLTAFAVDGNGKLWYTTQTAPTAELLPWRQATSAGDYAMSADFTVLPAGDGFEIVFRDNTNTVQVRKFVGGALQPARVAGGLVTGGVPAAVRFADGKVQIVVRGADATVYTQKEGTAGFTGWQPIAGQTAKGSPSAILNPHGIVEVAIRSDDNTVYWTGQTVPGSVTWHSWRTNLDQADTDPTAVSVSGTESRIFFIGTDANYRLAHYPPFTSNTGQAAPR